MKYSTLIESLKALCPTYEGGAPKDYDAVAIVNQYGLHRIRGDGRDQLRLRKVQIDLFKRSADANDVFFLSILDTLDDLGIAFAVQDMSYDESFNAMRCIIECEVL